MDYLDFSTAEDEPEFELIPKGTELPLILTIQKPKDGGYDDPERGWTDGVAYRNDQTGSVYINVKYIVKCGEWANRQIFGIIGLHSEKGVKWRDMGRAFIKSILRSHYGIEKGDNSAESVNKLNLSSLEELNGMEFVGIVAVEEGIDGELRNTIKKVSNKPMNELIQEMREESRNPVKRVSEPPKRASKYQMDDDIPF